MKWLDNKQTFSVRKMSPKILTKLICCKSSGCSCIPNELFTVVLSFSFFENLQKFTKNKFTGECIIIKDLLYCNYTKTDIILKNFKSNYNYIFNYIS